MMHHIAALQAPINTFITTLLWTDTNIEHFERSLSGFGDEQEHAMIKILDLEHIFFHFILFRSRSIKSLGLQKHPRVAKLPTLVQIYHQLGCKNIVKL